MFSFNFWTNAIHPLGARWTVSPEPYTISQPNADPNFYLGYSVESSCSQQPFIPPSNRSNQVYILGKWFQFFSGTTSKGWPPEFYDAAAEAAGISFVVGAIKSPWNTTTAIEGPDVKLPKNITNHGLLPQKEFLEVLAHSRMLIGVGDPATSPTPYDALCLGVPFLNPVGTWDRSNPKDKIRWNTQHNPLKLFGPPYVYNVLAGSKSEFIKAIKDAVENPLPERYILERMTISAVKARTATLIETDWRTEAGKLLEEWRRSGRTDLFEI
ncbi:uncharacterized protein EI90DRAFT_3121533 [Cantharellus anzutake]|uniref:uncharacterized protein n=1 Tax=Cantharellus anzutake TaxID=1750568 RepID=UPI0019034A50|nr:uncharacterized protein EI90DRAFT_3121533 [Cantharellus anzutake]KAF8334198.1 hypothetical protein EI90DRAFT_3121533 [Cantharellus anzutake]